MLQLATLIDLHTDTEHGNVRKLVGYFHSDNTCITFGNESDDILFVSLIGNDILRLSGECGCLGNIYSVVNLILSLARMSSPLSLSWTSIV